MEKPIIAFIANNKNNTVLNKILAVTDFEILLLEKIPKKKDLWKNSPHTIIIDTETQENYEYDLTFIKEIEEYEFVPIILIASHNLSEEKRINQLQNGIFTHIYENSIESLIFIINSALSSYTKHKEMYLKVNELNRLLSTNYLVIDSKNTLLEKVKEKIDKISKSNNHLKKELEGLSNDIEDNIRKEYHYQLFKVHFEEIHPQFFHNVLFYNNNLTDNNLKLLAFLKMGFNNSEISFLLSVSTAAVLKAIQRLKKKLNIAPNNSLREFVFNVKS